ncbi:ribonuclease HI, partial [Rhizobium leguminosarum]|nr:ribonuclease HI [Rhizobium leguminosarum]
TDGASSGNPGPGAYAAILQYKDYRKELVQGFRKSTNNRMELWAVIAGLEALKKEKQHVVVYSDSRYVVDAVEKGWLQNWIKKGFKGKKNIDLWKRFWALYIQHHVTFKWVKGHAGDPKNERCDQLATERIRTGPLDIDEAYESDLRV